MKFRRLVATAIFSLLFAFTPPGSAMAAPQIPSVKLDTSDMGPREIEDLTEQKILRDYSAAWRTLASALDLNRPALLNDYFTGFAKTNFVKAVAEQRATGMHRKYADRGHKLQGIFYSQDGGVMQLRDTAEYEVQVFDGDKLLYSEPKTASYVVIMTPAADRWMVRLLQEEPAH